MLDEIAARAVSGEEVAGEDARNLTLLVERESFAMLVASVFLFLFALASRLLLGWYLRSKLGIARERLRDQILRAGQLMAGSP